MASKKFSIKKNHALLISLLIVIIVVITLFVPLFNSASVVPIKRNVNITGLDIISAVFSSEDSLLSYEATIVLKNTTGTELALTLKNSEQYKTLFTFISTAYFVFLLAALVLFGFMFYIATFDTVPKFAKHIYKYSHCGLAVATLFMIIVTIITSITLTFNNEFQNIVVFSTTCSLGFTFYASLVLTLLCIPTPLFLKKAKK